jgi:hypothetical protein
MTERGGKKRRLFDPQANEALVSASPHFLTLGGAAESLGELENVAQPNSRNLMGLVLFAPLQKRILLLACIVHGR